MEKLLSIREARDFLGISRSTMERLIARGDLTVVWVSPRKRAISSSDLAEYLDDRRNRKPQGVPVV